jgi:hypothetical protein
MREVIGGGERDRIGDSEAGGQFRRKNGGLGRRRADRLARTVHRAGCRQNDC